MEIELPPSSVDVDIPKTSRGKTREPNPYDAVIAELNEKRGTARLFKFRAREDNDDDNANLRQHRNAMHRAGRYAGVSARISEERLSRNQVGLTLWVVDKITRARKEEND